MTLPHDISPVAAPPEAGPASSTPDVILVGNPNVGKSLLFSRLTGKFVVISNYPGTTVDLARGRAEIGGKEHTLLDTPGVNELAPRTEDARVTCAVLRDNPGATVVQVADAKNLRRALLLTLQLAEAGHPMVLVLNMMDELDRCGGTVDTRKLAAILGIPVIPTVATSGTGIHLLKGAIGRATKPAIEMPAVAPFGPEATAAGTTAGEATHPEASAPPVSATTDEAVARDAVEADPVPGDREYESTRRRLEQVHRILSRTYRISRPHRPSLAQKLGWWATQPLRGVLLLALVLYFAFWFVGLVGAGEFVDLLETGVFGRHVAPWAIRAVDAALPFPHAHATEASELAPRIPFTPAHGITLFESTRETVSTAYAIDPGAALGPLERLFRLVHDFLVGDYGLVTMALSYGLAIVLPIVTLFFLLFGVLEDSGYLPRLAVMVNRIFRRMGLNGKAVLPMVLGLGCDTMATMTTRVLETRKERVVTTLLLALAVPCSAQLGVLMAMVARISWGAAAFWVALMVVVAFGIGWLAARLYGGESGDFILELPPMRRPSAGNVAVKTVARLEWYLKEVIPLFAIGTAALFVLDELHLLDRIARLVQPVVTGWLGLPLETANAFLVGFFRRDYGAVYLLDAATGPDAILSSHQVLVAMVTITLFMPCVATLFMIAKELGKKTAAFITVFVFTFAFLVGGVVNRVAGILGL